MNISDAEINGLIDYCTNMVYRRYQNFPFIDDLIETVPTSVWSAIKRYKPMGAKLSTICIQRTYWRCQDVIANKFLTRDGEFRPDYTVDVDSDVVKTMVAEAEVDRGPEVDELLKLLDDNDRELLTLHYLEGMTLAEIAAIKCVTPQWLCIKKHRALRRLRAKMKLKVRRTTMPERKKITYEYSGEQLTLCGKCNATIFFVKTATGKTMPVNFETKESHFVDCPAAAQFRKK